MRGRRPGALAIAVGLGLGVLASRLPFLTTTLWSWDSVLYARALEQGFHVGLELAEQRPQAPGYLFYVLTASALRGLLVDSNAALVAVSALASAVGTAALFLFARRFARTGIALLVAVAYAAAPLVWTYSEVAFPYSLLGALSIGLAALFWAVRAAPARRLLVACVAFGLAAGFRQDLLLLLGPLWLWTVGARGPRFTLLAAGVVAAASLTWLVPSALLSGGPGAYLGAVIAQAGSASAGSAAIGGGLSAVAFNLESTLTALLWGGVGAALLVIALAAWLRSDPTRPSGLRGPQARFLALWSLPGLLIYVLVHIGDWGYVSSILPALYLLLAILAEHALGARRVPGMRWRVLGTAVALAPALLFVIGTDRFSAAALREHDAAVSQRAAYVRANFRPAETIILAREDFLTARYYLPEYRAWRYDPGRSTGHQTQRRRAMRATNIVVFTDGLVPRSPLEARTIRLGPHLRMRQVPIQPGDVVELTGDRYRIRGDDELMPFDRRPLGAAIRPNR